MLRDFDLAENSTLRGGGMIMTKNIHESLD